MELHNQPLGFSIRFSLESSLRDVAKREGTSAVKSFEKYI